jgi:hypothetical protein
LPRRTPAPVFERLAWHRTGPAEPSPAASRAVRRWSQFTREKAIEGRFGFGHTSPNIGHGHTNLECRHSSELITYTEADVAVDLLGTNRGLLTWKHCCKTFDSACGCCVRTLASRRQRS